MSSPFRGQQQSSEPRPTVRPQPFANNRQRRPTAGGPGQRSSDQLSLKESRSGQVNGPNEPHPPDAGGALGSSLKGKSAFDWDVYKSRKSALQYLKATRTQIDTILETEDGTACEYVHSQVMSAFGDALHDYIQNNGIFVDSYKSVSFARGAAYRVAPEPPKQAQASGGPARRSSWDGSQQATSGAHSAAGKSVLDQTGASKSVARCRVSLNNRHADWGRWPGRVKLVRLPKLNKYTLTILADCAYTGYIRSDLSSGGIWQVLEVADHYKMDDVIRACCAFLIKNLNRSNCVYFYHIGLKYRHTLQRSAWHQIRANFKHILYWNLQQSRHASQKSAQPSSSSSRRPSRAEQPQRPVEQSSVSLSTLGRSVATKRAASSDSSVESEAESSSASSCSSRICTADNAKEERERRLNNLATIKYEHFEPLLMHDRLNIDDEETVWRAIKFWCQYDVNGRRKHLAKLLNCVRFPRLRGGTEYTAQVIWRDWLLGASLEAQHELALLDRNHRDFLSGSHFVIWRDGFSLPCAVQPRQLRPRVPQSIVLAIGGWQQGQPTTLVESYDMNCNIWLECRRRIMTPLAYHGVECIGGVLWICGGTDGSEILNEVFTFNPIQGDCSQRPSMRESRCYVSTAYIEGYHLYAMGGHNGLHRMRSVERYDLVSQSWEHVQDMNVARSDASACVHESLIYIAGGLNDQMIESSVEFYNHMDNTWTYLSSMRTPRTSFTLLLFNKSLLAIGGNNGTDRLASVERYDFASRRWTAHSEMRHKRSTFSAALLDDNKLIVVGGYNGQTPFSQVEVFDSRLGAWQPMQKIRYDRSGLRVVTLTDLPNAAEYSFAGAHNERPPLDASMDIDVPSLGAALPASAQADTAADAYRIGIVSSQARPEQPATSARAPSAPAPAPSLAQRARQRLMRTIRRRAPWRDLDGNPPDR